MSCIMFHGTTKERAEKILKYGFRKGTFFATHLEDSLHMGGNYIFEVFFNIQPTLYWEYVCKQPISSKRIRSCYRLLPKLIFHSEECEKNIKINNLKEEFGKKVELCKKCFGRGQLEYYPPFTPRKDFKITVCPKCFGYGYRKIKKENKKC